MTSELIVLQEPLLKFTYGQKVADPRDGLTLYGPFDRGQINDFSVGIMGPRDGIFRLRRWLGSIHHPVFSNDNDITRPLFPGIKAAFDVEVNMNAIVELPIETVALEQFYKFKDAHQRVAHIVDLYVNEIARYVHEESTKVDLWFIVIPDMVYTLCRPKSNVLVADGINIGLPRKNRETLQLFDEDERLHVAYSYENDFHNQLKAKLLNEKILTQIVRESTIAYKDFKKSNGAPKRDLSKFESAIAWNIVTTMYYKIGGLPWKLGDIRGGVCYIGLVFKQDQRYENQKYACCAAQMFLDSGDGMVFRGALGPWYNPDRNEYHLDRKSSKDLIVKALDAFKRANNALPREIFIHGRTFFDDDEWSGFRDAVPESIEVVGIRIRDEKSFKLFRSEDFPVLRGTAYIVGKSSAYLWTKGFIPRLQSVLGHETPDPLHIKIVRGRANIRVVCEDILALTKLNYNTCMYCEGQPVTLRFADAIGEILTAGPALNSEVLPFKYYI